MNAPKHDGQKGTRLFPTIDNTAKWKGRERAWPTGSQASDLEKEKNNAFPKELGVAKWREKKIVERKWGCSDVKNHAEKYAEEKPTRGQERNNDVTSLTDVVESFVGIDHQNLPFVKSNFASRINSENVVPIIDLFIHNLFFHLKSIGKNIDNFYLRFDKIVYPFHFPFRKGDICDECLLNENKRRKMMMGWRGERWCACGQEHQDNGGRKKGSEFLPQVLNAWCERVKCLITIYNKNRKKQKIKEYLEGGGREWDSEDGSLLFDRRSRYDMNECAKGLVESILLGEDRWKKLKHVSFFPTGKKKQFVKNKSGFLTHEREDHFLPDLFRQKRELWNEEINDLYLINLIKRKIEDYIKNIQVKKFWDVINVQYLANFDYRYAGGVGTSTSSKGLATSSKGLSASSKGLATSSKGLATSSKGLATSYKGLSSSSRGIAPPRHSIYREPIYDYIQMVKKSKCKKEGKNSQVGKETNKVKNQVMNGNKTGGGVDRGKTDKEFMMKDLFNNTIKNYESNEIQIFLSNYDNVFLKSIGRFYLLLNFSVEIVAILYENLDLYSLHIFSLYRNFDQYGRDGGVPHQTDSQCSKPSAGGSGRSLGEHTFSAIANKLLCSLPPAQRRLDMAVFLLLRVFLRGKHETPCVGPTANGNEPFCVGSQVSGSLLDEIHNLKVEKYKEIIKEVIKLIKYIIEKKIHSQKPVLKYLLRAYKKYNQKIHMLEKIKGRRNFHSDQVTMLRRNFLLHSMNFYYFDFFTKEHLRINLRGIPKWRNKRKELRIPGHCKRRVSLYKWTFSLREVDPSSRGWWSSQGDNPTHDNLCRIYTSSHVYRPWENSHFGKNMENLLFRRVNERRLRRARRVRHLRALRLRVYTYFRLALHLGVSSVGGKKKERRKKWTSRKKGKGSSKGKKPSGGICRDRKLSCRFKKKAHLFVLSFYKNNLVKSLNVERIRHKFRALVRSKNAVYRKVVQKARERFAMQKKTQVEARDKYYDLFMDVLSIIKRQDEEIRSNLFGMIRAVSEQLNLFYRNICRCAPGETWEEKNVELAMHERLGTMRRECSVRMDKGNRGNAEEGQQSGEGEEAMSDEICRDVCNGDHRLLGKIAEHCPSRGGKRTQRRCTQKGKDSHATFCAECRGTIDKHLLHRKEKLFNHFHNMKNYYKEKMQKINYLSYDVSILKEYLCAYVKKFFGDIILLFEYLFCVSNSPVGVNCGNQEGGEKKEEDLLFEWFALSSVDNFNNEGESVGDSLNIKQAKWSKESNCIKGRKRSKEYENYLLLKKLKFFAKNDIIQFMSKSINCAQNQVLLKIGNVKKAFYLLHALLKTQGNRNELFIYKLLLSLVVKYGEYCQRKEMKKRASIPQDSSLSNRYSSTYELEKYFLQQKKRKKFLSKFGLDCMNIPGDVTSFLKDIIQGCNAEHTGKGSYGKTVRANGNTMDIYTSCLYNMSSCGKDDHNLNSILQKIIKKQKKKNVCLAQSKAKTHSGRDTYREDLLLSDLSTLYEVIHSKNLEKYVDLRVFITMVKKRKNNRKRKFNCDEILATVDMSESNDIIKKVIKRYTINFVDDNKYVFPYICNTFDFISPGREQGNSKDSSNPSISPDSELDYEVIQLNNNFKFFHFINPGREYSFSNSILNFVYGYPVLCIRKDLEDCVVPEVSLHKGETGNAHVEGSKESVQKLLRKRKRKELLRHLSNVDISNSIPLKYMHLSVMGDIFRYLKLEHILIDTIKKIYEEMLQTVQEKFLRSNDTHHLANAVTCFLLYFTSFIDILLGVRDNNYINLTYHGDFNIFNNFNGALFRKQKKKRGEENLLKGYVGGKESYVYMHNRYSRRSTYLWLLWNGRENEMGSQVEHIYVCPRGETSLGIVPGGRLVALMSNYGDFNFSFLNNGMCVDEYKGKQYLFVVGGGKELEKTTEGETAKKKGIDDSVMERTLLFRHTNVSVHSVEESVGCEEYPPFLTGGILSHLVRWGDSHLGWTQNFELVEGGMTSMEMKNVEMKNGGETNVEMKNVEMKNGGETNVEMTNGGEAPLGMIQGGKKSNSSNIHLNSIRQISFTHHGKSTKWSSATSSLVERIGLALTILKGYLKETLNLKRHCLVDALENFKECKRGLEDIKFIYHLIYLLDLDGKEKKAPDSSIFKKVYYLLVEALFGGEGTLPEGEITEKGKATDEGKTTEKEKTTEKGKEQNEKEKKTEKGMELYDRRPLCIPPRLDTERVITFIFNLVKITRVIKMRKEKIERIFKLFQMYVERSPDFYESIFNRLFLFIYEDTKEENRRFLRKHLNSYFNGKKITFHILNHILRSVRAGGQRGERRVKRERGWCLPWDHASEQRSVLENPSPIQGHIPRVKEEHRADACRTDQRSTYLSRKQHQAKRSTWKKMKFSSVKEEIFKKAFRMGRSIYSSDSCDSTRQGVFRVKPVESRNYLVYEREKANYFLCRLGKKASVENVSMASKAKEKSSNVFSGGSSWLVTSHMREEPTKMDQSNKKGNKRGEQLRAYILTEQLCNDNLWDETRSFSTSLCTNDEASIATRKGFTNVQDFTHSEENPFGKKSMDGYSSNECFHYVDNLYLHYENRRKGQRKKKSTCKMRSILKGDWRNKDEDTIRFEENMSDGSTPLSCTSSSYSKFQENSSEEDRQKICFYMDELNSRGGEKYLSLLSAPDFKLLKGVNRNNIFQSIEDIKRYPLEEEMEEVRGRYGVYNKEMHRLLTFPNDSSFCFIKYKPNYEFNENRRVKINKYNEKEKKRKKKKIDIMFMPLYISIAGGLDVFLFKYYQHICNTYVNPYFYMNTYYFERYIRKRYRGKRHSEQYLIHDPFYYHYLFCNKFGCHDSAKALRGARVGPHAYVKFFNHKGGGEAKMVSTDVLNSSDIAHVRIKEDVVREEAPSGVGSHVELTNEKVARATDKKKRLDSVVDKRSKQTSNEVRKTSKISSTEKKKNKIANEEEYNCGKHITQKESEWKKCKQNFFYAENELSTDDEEGIAPKEPKDIHIFKRHLFILDYLKGYFSFSIFTRMENMIGDMFENYLLNMPYVNKYVLVKSDSGCRGNVEYEVLLPKGAVVPMVNGVVSALTPGGIPLPERHFTSSRPFPPDNATYHDLVGECFVHGSGVQLSMTVVNVEYWKFEDMKEEDTIVKKLIPENLYAYFNVVNKIYQKKNADKHLVFLFNLCYLDLCVNDYFFTVNLAEGLVYLFLTTLEVRTVDLYKDNLQSDHFDTNNCMYNFDFLFISSTYKSVESRTIHIIVNERMVLYDFHLIKNAEEISSSKSRKNFRVNPPQKEATFRGQMQKREGAPRKVSLTESHHLQRSLQNKGGESIIEKDKEFVGELTKKVTLPKFEESYMQEKKNESENVHMDMSEVKSLSSPQGDTEKEDRNKMCGELSGGRKHSDGDTNPTNTGKSRQNNSQEVETIKKKNISTENVYYNLTFLKEYQENEIRKLKSKKVLDDVDVKFFFTEEYLIQKSNLPDRFIRETLKKLTRMKLLQRNTFKVMNKRNNKSTQFVVYTTSELDDVDEMDVCERRVKDEEVMEPWEKVPERDKEGSTFLHQFGEVGEVGDAGERRAPGEEPERDQEGEPEVGLRRRQGGTRHATRERSEEVTRQRSIPERANTPDPTPRSDRRRKLPIGPSDLCGQNTEEGKLQLAKKQKCGKGKSATGGENAPLGPPPPSSSIAPAPSSSIAPAPSSSIAPAPSSSIAPAPSSSIAPAPSSSIVPPSSSSIAPALSSPSTCVGKIKTERVTKASQKRLAGKVSSNGKTKKEKGTPIVSSSVVKFETSSMASLMNNSLGTCAPNEDIVKRESVASAENITSGANNANADIANADNANADNTNSGCVSTMQGEKADTYSGRHTRPGARSGNRNRTCKGGQEKGSAEGNDHEKAPRVNDSDNKKRTNRKRVVKVVKEESVVNSIVSYLSERKGNNDGTVKDHSVVKQGEATNPAGNSSKCSSSMNEPMDFFLDEVLTDNDEENEIKKRRTFDNLNLEETYEFYENHILKITTDRMNRMKAEPGRNTSTPLFLIVSSLNKILTERKMNLLSQPTVLAILNIMMKKNKVVRVGGNWQPT
ncbi:conserved Plasmodium protein, unknown function [Plasmodium knowlesi strain H]|uniref:Uncharacterized protein n=3 Tax=Plasmodium knowlesi TaxID=5850 RepID=A0A5K1VE03_PLAKH|nr:conserved Plasmodium protein, unknown function [Plasmodium knowlesi strain H]OTN65563.1 Uncharacterized protein PKNOH_S110072500 [Plasmodium knowlesi]CAA9989346.1 conserved Plasmodium protein, unknown function [Plasmodium knowlesi strain H]SBO24914.1 conserved Plasmodium protein, unknown function [Plasmodium knowlesi strain H]SBO27926.1 conserved Plasmodium protein, unknown function [Plasmodium knowlesi strain H]VVS78820.1 conserved Plasmodium protein, unknown function [Plasmodium knowlesi |eukprot:XP_002260073.1 hypothetical protein, conserved in Plasmodium species [Plasmodium knowlesi strain H]